MGILMVEDNPADAYLTTFALRQQGLGQEITVLDDGETAIAYLKARTKFEDAPRPELIILDLNLKRVDGMEVLRWIRANPAMADLPVIVWSSSPADAQGEAASKATQYLEKPGDLDAYMTIGRVVAEYLDKSAAG
jgi:CheY-like chemotaxis protein